MLARGAGFHDKINIWRKEIPVTLADPPL